MLLEGLVTQIIPQKERDLVARLLLRGGVMASVYVYGGMGGGKNAKPRVYEPGSMMRLEVRQNKTGVSQDMLTVAESSLIWRSERIRHDSSAFALMCLYLEMVMKTAVSFNPQDQHSHSQEHAGLFAVLSNALFHLDQALAEQNFHWRSHLLLFLSKFLHHLGVMPDESSCVFCGNALEGDVIAPLVQEQGGFACQDCVREANISTHNPLPVRPLLARAVRTSFKDWREIPEVPAPVNVQLMQFWSYHLHVKLPELASYRLLF